MTYWQPLSGLIIGVLVIAIYLYLYLRRKAEIVQWIAKYIFRQQFMSEKSAENLFNVATSFVATIGGLWIILAIYYLTY
jgi:hypothetical protein